jgi:hypothetical protein
VGGQGQGHHGRRLLEAKTCAGQRIDPRRARPGVSIAAKSIRTNGIERNE